MPELMYSKYLTDINPKEHVNETVEVNVTDKKGIRLIDSSEMDVEFKKVENSTDLELDITWQDDGQKSSKIIVKNYYKDTDGTAPKNPDFIYSYKYDDVEYPNIDYLYFRMSDMILSEQTAIKRKSKTINATDFDDTINMNSEAFSNIQNSVINTKRGDDIVYLNDKGSTVNCGKGSKHIYVTGGNNVVNINSDSVSVNIPNTEKPNDITVKISGSDTESVLINFQDAENLEGIDISLGRGTNKNDVIFTLGNDKITVKNGLKTLSPIFEIQAQEGSIVFENIVDTLKEKYPNRIKTLGIENLFLQQYISGTLMGENIVTGTGFDTVTLYSGFHSVTTGKGNDKLIMKNQSEALFYLNKGDGNDTIELGDGCKLNVVLDDRNAVINHYITGDNLVLDIVHYNEHGKKTASETLTIKNALNYGTVKDTVCFSYLDDIETILSFDDIIQDEFVLYSGNQKKNNFIFASYDTNVLVGGNKNDRMHSSAQSNTFITGSKGSTVIISDSETADDTYVVSSINNNTCIADNGAENKNLLQIHNASVNDLFFHFDIDNAGLIEAQESDYAVTSLHLQTGSDLSKSFKNNSYANPVSAYYGKKELMEHNLEAVAGISEFDFHNTNFVANVKGIGFSAIPYNFDFDLVNKKGNIETISSNTIVKALVTSHRYVNTCIYFIVQKLGGIFADMENTPEFLQNLRNFIVEDGKISSRNLVNECLKINSLSAKNLSADDKKILSDFKKYSSQILNDLSTTYKYTYMGTNGDDNYTNVKKETFKFIDTFETKAIISSTGNDTFNISKTSPSVEIVSGDGTIRDDRDKIVIKNYSLDDSTIRLGYLAEDFISPTDSDNHILIGLFNYSNKKLEDINYIEKEVMYSGLYGEVNEQKVQLQNLTLTDKNRSYNVNYINNAVGNFENGNNIIFAENSNTITLNNGYNLVYANSEGTNTINHNGGKDVYRSVSESNDTYNINFSENLICGIADYGGVDTLNVTSEDASEIRMFFNVDKEGNYKDIKLIDKDKMTSKNLNISDEILNKKGYAISTIKAGLLVYNSVENVNINNTAFDMNSMANDIKNAVVQWLNDSNKYECTADVFDKGNKNDINALIQIYKNATVAEYLA